jgi:hypothetical protein
LRVHDDASSSREAFGTDAEIPLRMYHVIHIASPEEMKKV